jgi:hypothetical protein
MGGGTIKEDSDLDLSLSSIEDDQIATVPQGGSVTPRLGQQQLSSQPDMPSFRQLSMHPDYEIPVGKSLSANTGFKVWELGGSCAEAHSQGPHPTRAQYPPSLDHKHSPS